jgi:hypothetical protein
MQVILYSRALLMNLGYPRMKLGILKYLDFLEGEEEHAITLHRDLSQILTMFLLRFYFPTSIIQSNTIVIGFPSNSVGLCRQPLY